LELNTTDLGVENGVNVGIDLSSPVWLAIDVMAVHKTKYLEVEFFGKLLHFVQNIPAVSKQHKTKPVITMFTS
jgi:hypothetical protein